MRPPRPPKPGPALGPAPPSTDSKGDIPTEDWSSIRVNPLDLLPWEQYQQMGRKAMSQDQRTYKFHIHRMHHRQQLGVTVLLQGDTGANVSATDMKHILWNYQSFATPIRVNTYATKPEERDAGNTDDQIQGTTCTAQGYGIIKIAGEDNSVMLWTALYTPGTNGTVLSPDRYMWDHAHPQRFHHMGGKDGKGAIWFTDSTNKECGRLKMQRRDGLWYTTNHILLPQVQQQRETQAGDITQSSGPGEDPQVNQMQATITPTAQYCAPRLATQDTGQWRIHAVHTAEEAPIHRPDEIARAEDGITKPKRTMITEAPLTTDEELRRIELWHQRMGHPGPYALWQTQQHVHGIPTLAKPEKTIFQCPFCDKAKLHKSPRNTKAVRRNEQPGTTFHMDLGFIRGPDNVAQLVERTEHKPGPTIQTSRKGYTCYLLIIDAATRYMWIFPLRSKQPPVKLVHFFLTKHGRSKGQVFTNRQGLLAQSRQFQEALQDHQYTLNEDDTRPEELKPAAQTQSRDDDPEHLAVRTDNGGELGNSIPMANTIASHGYILETTAPDTSSQNGMGERPHQTLKEKVRCLLYTAGLGTPSWADALAHTTWLYNRTYHTALGRTPFEAYTGRKPLCDKIITFGAKIVAKRTGMRRTALDPHTFDGIFLGYCSTQDNIRYWDIQTQCEKVTTHYNADELQYGDAPRERSPAAAHLMENHGGVRDHQERDPTHLKEPPVTVQEDPQFPHAAVATVQGKLTRQHHDEHYVQTLRQFDVTLDPNEPGIVETIPIKGTHPTLGLHVCPLTDIEGVQLHSCAAGSIAARTIRRYKSRLVGALVTHVNDTEITTAVHLVEYIAMARQRGDKHIRITFARPRWMNTSGDGIPVLQFDQLNVVAHHIHAIKTGEHLLPTDPKQWPTIQLASLMVAMTKGLHIPKMTRRRIQQDDPDNWPQFQASEWKQLDKYAKQEMFGEPCPPPKDNESVILPWVWAYSWKTDPITLEQVAKSRGTCNGGSRFGRVVTLAETFAACIEQPALRLFFAITAALNYTILGSDVANAFAEAPPPDTPLYMQVDTQFHEWWTKHCGRPAIPRGWVIPIQHALQGHPEAPRLWNKHIDGIIKKELGFTPVTQARCLYYKREPDTNRLTILLRQVDDFMIAAQTKAQADIVRKQLQRHMTNELNDLGVVKRFNGLDVIQAKRFVKIHCETYLNKVLDHHGWNKTPSKPPSVHPIPMRMDSAFLNLIATAEGPEEHKAAKALEDAMGFSYRQAIGELLFAMSTCRPDISTATVLLSQHASQPAKIHYQAVRAVFEYLRVTKSEGITYWRPQPSTEDLPDIPPPQPHSPIAELQKYGNHIREPTILRGGTDSTWASDRKHRRSVGGVYLMLAGGVVYYRTRIQPDTAQSSTEAELYSMTDAGKAALYIRSILDELDLPQEDATIIEADNKGAVQLSNAHQPTRHTRHVDMKHFVILEWTEEDKIHFQQTPTHLNTSDSLSKPTARIKHYEHFDIILGRRGPKYVQDHIGQTYSNTVNKVDASMFLRRIKWQDVLDAPFEACKRGEGVRTYVCQSLRSHSTSY